MPGKTVEQEFVSYVVDLMQTMGPVYAKRMFGGHGIFLDGLMFGLITDSTLYLKADNATKNDFTDKGLEAFTYIKQGRPCALSYYQAPDEALEDSEEMNLWTIKAYNTALKAASNKGKP